MKEKPYILTIDDDEDFNNLLALTLKKIGVHSKITTQPKDFLLALKLRTPDLVIVDLNLEVKFGAGFQIVQAIRESLGYQLPIFVLSKRSTREDISRALILGANDFISKPLDELVLISKIKQYLKLDEYDEKPLPFFNISEKDRDCNFNIQMNIVEIDEFGITLEGDYLIAKGSSIRVSGELLNQLTGSEELSLLMNVQSCWIDNDKNTSSAFLEFDANNEVLMKNIRSWILDHS
ncbi:MAG: response regulator transcription factor [Halobacteriovoraceae bacterium]|jgi:DNA-binding response OmpR family regulator|nr:response regulator transcription factor [Halobacteriovoraceae bacterium]MBT5093955.1 response regulator transcription factor [Halobacteriovoraceae bacterium]